MKQQILLLLFILPISCWAQNSPATQIFTTDNLEPGKCWFSVQLDNASIGEESIFQRPFILEAVPPKIEIVDVKYSVEELREKMENKEFVTIQILEHHKKFVIKKEPRLTSYTGIKNPIGFAYCLVETPAEYKNIYRNELLKDSLLINEKRIIEESFILKTYVDKSPLVLEVGQIYFESSSWSYPKEAVAGHGHRNIIIFKIKEKLISLGYEMKLNNEFDQESKKAIIDFQRKNNLKEGQLDIVTLKKLGIEY